MKITSALGEIRFRAKRDTDLGIGAYGKPAFPIPSPNGPKRLGSVEQAEPVDPIHPVHAASTFGVKTPASRGSRTFIASTDDFRVPRFASAGPDLLRKAPLKHTRSKSRALTKERTIQKPEKL